LPHATRPDERLRPHGPIAGPQSSQITHYGAIALLGDHRLLCGDSSKPEDVDRLLDGAEIHLVNTDPPYNVRLMYSVAA
jgi:DNA modification methylase